ncbi:MAG: restriction endonuclease [Candidatus Paceibacterota bacterium]|jgi:HJR/Mrr/RecB family endonuclease
MRRQSSLAEELYRPVIGLFGIYLLVMALSWFGDRARFWRWLGYFVVAIVAAVATIIGVRMVRGARHKKIQEQIAEKHLEEYIKNFISSFGFGQDGRRGSVWHYRNHTFDWHRINDLMKYLADQRVVLKPKEVTALLRGYIDEREMNRTVAGSAGVSKHLHALSGVEFEGLLYRLFEKMEYVTQHVGHAGDQGGDLVIQKGDERIVVQAKAYRDWTVSNAAIQEAVAAKNFYNCNKAMVVTTSEFTQPALDLAKVNDVSVVSKEKLQEWLAQYLKENWV